MTVRTRFAPSPTGVLHLGSVRTALFCWLYAHHCDGKYVLRIEDTDRGRSTSENVEAILDGINALVARNEELSRGIEEVIALPEECPTGACGLLGDQLEEKNWCGYCKARAILNRTICGGDQP